MGFSMIVILINLVILIGAILCLFFGIKYKNRYMLAGAVIIVIMMILEYYALNRFITSM